MRRLINYKKSLGACFYTTIGHSLRRSVHHSVYYSTFISREDAKFLKYKPQRFIFKNSLCDFAKSLRLCVKPLIFLCAFVSLWLNSQSQRQDISLNNDWLTSLQGTSTWKQVNIPIIGMIIMVIEG
jgi:hypothetical protein